ncbi:MAG: TlpA disulfide reductase family protein [Pseudomonadota bacterium]
MKKLHLISLIALILFSTSYANQGEIFQPTDAIASTVENQLEDGRWELVMFWATYCGLCKDDFKKLQEFMDDNPDLDFTLVGVVVDGVEQKAKTEALIEKYDLNYAHILTDFDTANEFYTSKANVQLIGTPSYLLYDKENKVAGANPNAIDIEALDLFIER